MRLHPFAGKTYASPNGCNTNSNRQQQCFSAAAHARESGEVTMIVLFSLIQAYAKGCNFSE